MYIKKPAAAPAAVAALGNMLDDNINRGSSRR